MPFVLLDDGMYNGSCFVPGSGTRSVRFSSSEVERLEMTL
jgi:hypothetical protein